MLALWLAVLSLQLPVVALEVGVLLFQLAVLGAPDLILVTGVVGRSFRDKVGGLLRALGWGNRLPHLP